MCEMKLPNGKKGHAMVSFVAMAIVLAGVLLMLMAAEHAQAQSWPARPVRLVVPFSNGTGPDVIARSLGQKLSERWTQPVVVDNRPGASGNIGAEIVAKAAPDGLTLMVLASTFSVSPSLYANLPFDPLRSFTHVSLIATGTMALAVHAAVAARDLNEFIALLKAQPGKFSYSSPGNGTAQHVVMELFKLTTGTEILHVPYKAAAQAQLDVASGQISATVLPVNNSVPLMRGNRIRLLAAGGSRRSPVSPEVPSFEEQGLRGIDPDIWFALFGPAGLPEDVLKKIHGDIQAALREAEIKEVFGKLGMEPTGSSSEAMRERLAQDLQRWSRVVREAKIKAD